MDPQTMVIVIGILVVIAFAVIYFQIKKLVDSKSSDETTKLLTQLVSDMRGSMDKTTDSMVKQTRAINERFISEGIRIDGVIALGGVAKKSPLVMQIVCDVLNMPIKVARSEQTCALGSSMAASVVAGIHPNLETAQQAMGGGIEKEYFPDKKNAGIYNMLYEKYKRFGRFVEMETAK